MWWNANNKCTFLDLPASSIPPQTPLQHSGASEDGISSPFASFNKAGHEINVFAQNTSFFLKNLFEADREMLAEPSI